jgi:hypothetical protein
MAKKISLLDSVISNEYFKNLQNYLNDLKNELRTFRRTQPIDSEYYRRLLVVENGKLKESYIAEDDPFFPIYKFVKDLTGIYNRLEESPALDENDDISISSFFKSILSYRKDFINNLNIAMCGRYSFKLNHKNFRTYVRPEFKNRINNMILRHIDIQQDLLNNRLSQDQKNLPEFISSTATYESLKNSYDEFCVDENNMEDITIFNYLNEIKSNAESKTENFDKRLHFVPKDFYSEALAFEQNDLGFHRSRRDVGSDNNLLDVSHMSVEQIKSNAFAPYAHLPLLFISIFILMVLFKVKKIF